jgi:hyperosmotically inducible periplasmic protein
MSNGKSWFMFMMVTAALAGVSSTYAQTDTASAAPTKKEIRKQNHQLELKVRHALTATKRLDSAGIVIVARGGEVTLDGDAPDADQIQVAAATTSKVSGVTDVRNLLHVREAGH